jgi:hypothetical protein
MAQAPSSMHWPNERTLALKTLADLWWLQPS